MEELLMGKGDLGGTGELYRLIPLSGLLLRGGKGEFELDLGKGREFELFLTLSMAGFFLRAINSSINFFCSSIVRS
jgi:hypothetical protein